MDLSALPDGDLLHLFRSFAVNLPPDALHDKKNESHALVLDEQHQGRSLALTIEVGRYGEKGRVVDTTTMTEKLTFESTDAIQVITHGVLLLPAKAKSALLFVERANNQSGVLKLLEQFTKHFRLCYPDHILEADAVVESEAWLHHAQLLRVSAHRHYKQQDRFDNYEDAHNESIAGELAYTLVPKAGRKWLPRWIFDGLMGGTVKASQLLSFPEDTEESETEVTLEGNGRKKTFIIGKERRPSVSWPLSDHNEEAWSLDKIRSYVFGPDRAKDVFDRFGIDWTESNTLGAWTTEEMEAKMVIRGGEQS